LHIHNTLHRHNTCYKVARVQNQFFCLDKIPGSCHIASSQLLVTIQFSSPLQSTYQELWTIQSILRVGIMFWGYVYSWVFYWCISTACSNNASRRVVNWMCISSRITDPSEHPPNKVRIFYFFFAAPAKSGKKICADPHELFSGCVTHRSGLWIFAPWTFGVTHHMHHRPWICGRNDTVIGNVNC
jgi:hypothetical protein